VAEAAAVVEDIAAEVLVVAVVAVLVAALSQEEVLETAVAAIVMVEAVIFSKLSLLFASGVSYGSHGKNW